MRRAWGPRGHTGKVMIVVGERRKKPEGAFDSVEEFAQDTNPQVEWYERGPIDTRADLCLPQSA